MNRFVDHLVKMHSDKDSWKVLMERLKRDSGYVLIDSRGRQKH